MDNVNKFLALFSEFDMIVRTRDLQPTKVKKKEFNVTTTQVSQAKSDLERELRRLTNEYKKARRSFKHNRISRQELFDFEWRIHELQEEIKRIEESDEL